MLTDRGTEFCGTRSHEYELYLAVEDIDHTPHQGQEPADEWNLRALSQAPCSDEFYRVAFRKKIYRSIAELQADLDAWMRDYNGVGPHQGRWCFGKTPMQTFLDTLPLTKENPWPPDHGRHPHRLNFQHRLSVQVSANTNNSPSTDGPRSIPAINWPMTDG